MDQPLLIRGCSTIIDMLFCYTLEVVPLEMLQLKIVLPEIISVATTNRHPT